MLVIPIATLVSLNFWTFLFFQVDSRVLVAVENGPVILEVTLKYTGNRDLIVHKLPYETPYSATPPAGWGPWVARKPEPIFFCGVTVRAIHPGDTLVRLVSPTSRIMCSPKPGVCEITIEGGLVLALADGSVVGHIPLPTHVQQVTVEPLTPEVETKLLTMVKQGVSRLNDGKLSREAACIQAELLEDIVRGSQGELRRLLAVQVLQAGSSVTQPAYLYHIAGYPGEFTERRLNALLAHFASAHPYDTPLVLGSLSAAERYAQTQAQTQSARLAWAWWLIDRYAKRDQWLWELLNVSPTILTLLFPPPALSDEHVARIVDFAVSHGPDLSIMVHSAFGSRLSAKSKRQLETTIARGTSAKSTEDIIRLIAKLDADDFDERVKAADSILARISEGNAYELVTKAHAQGNLSAEVNFRLTGILRDPRITNTAILRKEVLHEIESGRLSIDTLRLIASGDEKLAIVQAAKAQLNKPQDKPN
jgi:hypothetical protein